MKILHTSDWHLGLDFYGASLLRDQEAMVDRIADIAARERVGAVLLAGDVFDRAVVGADAMGVYNRAMRRLCLEERIPVVVCAGNHDGAARLSLLQELLAPSGLHVFGRAGAQDDRVDLGEAVVHVLPYCTTDDARLSFPAEREAIGSAADAVAAFLAHRAPERDRRGAATAPRRSAARWPCRWGPSRPLTMRRWGTCTRRRRSRAGACATAARPWPMPLTRRARKRA